MNTTRTPHGALIQLSQLFNKAPVIQSNSTLNQKWNVAANETLAANEVPIASYIVIGNGGHQSQVHNNITSIRGVPRLTTASALYSHMPFLMTPVGNDISAAERAKYRGRVIEVHGGVSYVVYYIKVFSTSSVTITTDYTATSDSLTPVPPTAQTSETLATIASIPFVLDAEEITNIKEAQALIHGTEGFATISEIGLVTGVDRIVTGDNDGLDLDYTEVIAAQLHSSSNAGRLLDFTEAVSTPTTITVGSLDPLVSGT